MPRSLTSIKLFITWVGLWGKVNLIPPINVYHVTLSYINVKFKRTSFAWFLKYVYNIPLFCFTFIVVYFNWISRIIYSLWIYSMHYLEQPKILFRPIFECKCLIFDVSKFSVLRKYLLLVFLLRLLIFMSV